MIELSLVERCECEHCRRKLKQIGQSKKYWDKIIISEKRAA